VSLPPNVWFVEIREDDGSTSEDVFEQPQGAMPVGVDQVITTRRKQRQVTVEDISSSDPPPRHVGRIVARPFMAQKRP